MTTRTVLAIGIDAVYADFADFPDLSPALIRDYIDAQVARLHAHGFEVVSCLVDPGDGAIDVVTEALQTRRYDCVMISAGLREPPPYLLLFETVINLVHRLAPQARICFNTTPADTAEAVQRWVEA